MQSKCHNFNPSDLSHTRIGNQKKTMTLKNIAVTLKCDNEGCNKKERFTGDDAEDVIVNSAPVYGWSHCHKCSDDYCLDCIVDNNFVCLNKHCKAKPCGKCNRLHEDVQQCTNCDKLVCVKCSYEYLQYDTDKIYCSRECYEPVTKKIKTSD